MKKLLILSAIFVATTAQASPEVQEGFRVWRASNCAACHGAEQQGMVGPNLINSLQVLKKEEVYATVLNGRLARGMPSHAHLEGTKMDNLYIYLKARSDGTAPANPLKQ